MLYSYGDEMQSILKQLFSAYANSQISEGTAAVYYRILCDLDPKLLQAVVHQCIAELKFLPAVAEVREMYFRLAGRSGELAAAEAWGLVLQEIQRIGSWGKPEFANATVAEVVRFMGWRELCMSENPGVDRAQFMRMYDQVVARGAQQERLLPHVRQLLEAAQRQKALPSTHQGTPLPNPAQENTAPHPDQSPSLFGEGRGGVL